MADYKREHLVRSQINGSRWTWNPMMSLRYPSFWCFATGPNITSLCGNLTFLHIPTVADLQWWNTQCLLRYISSGICSAKLYSFLNICCTCVGVWSRVKGNAEVAGIQIHWKIPPGPGRAGFGCRLWRGPWVSATRRTHWRVWVRPETAQNNTD